MAILFRRFTKKIILSILLVSILLTFLANSNVYAKLDLKEGEYYYSGTTKGSYTPTEGIFSMKVNVIGEMADWLVGIATMLFRSTFVGLTAIVEKLLTWSLQTTTGVDINGELVENSTDIYKLIKSTDNITVAAIVFNKVPALDINFFKSYSNSDIVSGTGNSLICDCGKNCSECVKSDGTCNCGCGENGNPCSNCSRYYKTKENMENNTSIIQKLKNELAKWYYAMLLLAFATMLVILIAIGIKMAISNVAAEKALYKRMLFDWLVGFIIIVSIHFVMLFLITTNETLVNVIHEQSIRLNAEKMKKLNLMTLSEEAGKANYNNQELEIKVYEEIRTRGYDPKLTVGLPGMIMYMSLVYFAIRYTIVYLRRYLTIMVLTLMGPGLGVSYALQKVFHGKSPAYSKWLKEYSTNVIIQTVHAILYTIFIAEGLVLALDSLAGMVIALVFFNYTLKADKLFRKIFHMDDGGNSLLGQTSSAGDVENVKKNFDAVKGLVKADATKEIIDTLTHAPYAVAVKGVGKAAVAGAAAVATGAGIVAKKAVSAIPQETRDNLHFADGIINAMDEKLIDKYIENYESQKDLTKTKNGQRKTRGKVDFGTFIGNLRGVPSKARMERQIRRAKSDAIHAKTKEEQETAILRYERAVSNKEKVDRIIEQPSFIKYGYRKFKRAVDIRNTFNISSNQPTISSVGEIWNAINGKGHTDSKVAAIWRGVFGTTHIDPKTGKRVSDKNGLYSQFSPTNIFGLTAEGKKAIKTFAKTFGGGFLGIAGMAVGMGTIVAHPKVGLAFLSAGRYKAAKISGFRPPRMSDYRNRRYTFEKFSDGALANIQGTIREQAIAERDAISRENEVQLKEKLKDLLRRISDLSRRNPEGSTRRKFRNANSLQDLRRRISEGKRTTKAGIKLKAPRSQGLTFENASEEPIAEETLFTREELEDILTSIDDRIKAEDTGEIVVQQIQRRARNPILFNIEEEYKKMMEQLEDDADKDYRGAEKAKYNRTTNEWETVIEDPQVIEDFEEKLRIFDETAETARDLQLLLQYDRLIKRATKKADKKANKEALKETYEKLGYSYDSEKGELSRDSGNGKKEVIKAVSIDAIDTKKAKREYDPEDLLRMKIEIKAALESLSGGSKIDLKNRRTYRKLIKDITARLKKADLIAEGQTVEEIFKKEKLLEILGDEEKAINQKNEEMDRALSSMLGKDDAKAVKKALFRYDEVTLTSSDPSVIAEKIFGKVLLSFGLSDEEKREKEEILKEELVSVKFDREIKDLVLINKSTAISSKYVETVNREICDIIELISNGNILEMDESTLSRILKLLSDKLSNIGYLGKRQQIDDIFAKGSLERIIKDKISRHNKAVESTESRMLSEKIKERFDYAEKAEAIKRYTEGQVENQALSGEISNTAARGRESQTRSSKSKLQQIIASGLDEYEREMSEDLLSDILQATEGMSESGGEIVVADGSIVELSPSEATTTKEAIKILVQMRDSNKKAQKKRASSINSITEELYRKRIQSQLTNANTPEAKAMIETMMEEYRNKYNTQDRKGEIEGPIFDLRDIVTSDVASAAIANERIAAKNKKKMKSKHKKND